MGFDQVFNIVSDPVPCPECLDDLPDQDQSEEEVRIKVLEAHKILMGLNDSNREAFHDLVNALEGLDPWVLLRLTALIASKLAPTLECIHLWEIARDSVYRSATSLRPSHIKRANPPRFALLHAL